ncbi:DUF4892 domain-containing protein [Marinomonas aquiplantarum]|uniref:Uncharacterized protein DUF4892 n=1 Tax=Marinomonas aquiplantarum TaxID=491951 RepID=A0A366CYN0_9GAMM|nr:DUF4892 domain-containing protein [Marinomonas aquiplantarum]RBO82786.1 uncharacterized protein DUF4892 [Marinomonas aquiplantarum]
MVKLGLFALLGFSWASFTFADSLGVESYRDAQLVKSRSEQAVSVEVPLAKIQRSGRGWEPEKVERLTGNLVTSLYKIDRNALLTDVYQHYYAELTKNNHQILFECQSRSCGSSNAWANNFFDDYLLYGSDQSQSLLVVKTASSLYQILYVNRRGAGDVMVRLDQVAMPNEDMAFVNVMAQHDINDIPRIRRLLTDLPAGQSVIGFVTSQQRDRESAVSVGDRYIEDLISGLGVRLAEKVRFINLADMGRASLGVDRVSFVMARP